MSVIETFFIFYIDNSRIAKYWNEEKLNQLEVFDF